MKVKLEMLLFALLLIIGVIFLLYQPLHLNVLNYIFGIPLLIIGVYNIILYFYIQTEKLID